VAVLSAVKRADLEEKVVKKHGIVLTAVLVGIVALAMAVFAFLALSDIAHGEPDLTLEWAVVRVALATMVVSQILALAAIARLSWAAGRHGTESEQQQA